MNENFHYKGLQISAVADKATIRVEGVIGIPEWWQFEESDEIIVSTKEKMRNELETIANLKSKEIVVEIDSYGGDANHALAIYNALKATGSKVETKYTGWSASAATIVGMAGSERKAPSNFMMLVHEGRGGATGTKETFENYANWLGKLNKIIVDIYVNNSTATEEEIVNLMAIDGGEGKWITADEALGYGLLTSVDSEMRAAAIVENTTLSKWKLPKVEENLINNKMAEEKEKSLKDKILELTGYKNDEKLKEENTSLAAKVDELEKVIENKPEMNKEEFAALVNEKTELENSLATKKKEVENKVNEIEQITKEKSDLEAKVKGLEDQVKAKGINVDAKSDPNTKGEGVKLLRNDYSVNDLSEDTKELNAELKRKGGNI